MDGKIPVDVAIDVPVLVDLVWPGAVQTVTAVAPGLESGADTVDVNVSFDVAFFSCIYLMSRCREQ